MQKLKVEIHNLSDSAYLANVDFSYRDLIKNFDRSKVKKGVDAKLIKVKYRSTVTTLEVDNVTTYIRIYK